VVSHAVGSRVLVALVTCATAGACNSILGNDQRESYVPLDGSADDGDLTSDGSSGDSELREGSIPPPDDAEGDGSTMAQDSGADAGPGDAVSDASVVDSAPTCTPIAPFASACEVTGVGAEQLTAPREFCSHSEAVRYTPAACQGCVELYTCECIEAAGAFACGGNPVTCQMVNGVPTFGCN
jgi:hypothetical protein